MDTCGNYRYNKCINNQPCGWLILIRNTFGSYLVIPYIYATPKGHQIFSRGKKPGIYYILVSFDCPTCNTFRAVETTIIIATGVVCQEHGTYLGVDSFGGGCGQSQNQAFGVAFTYPTSTSEGFHFWVYHLPTPLSLVLIFDKSLI